MNSIAVFRKLGAERALLNAATLLEKRNITCGVMVDSSGRLDITGAIFVACGGKIALLHQCGGDPAKAGISDININLVNYLVEAFEALVDEDITVWGDNHSCVDATKMLYRLAGFFK